MSVDIEKYENLPQREGRRDLLAGEWGSRRSANHKVNGVFPYKIINRVIKAYINKPFDKAFSYYCSLVPIYQQHLFIEEFQPKRWRNNNEYYLDSAGTIKKRKVYKDKSVTFYSIDYEYRYEYFRNGKQLREWEFPKSTDERVCVVIGGYKKTFSSKKDPEFIKLTAEKMQQLKKIKRERDKQWASKEFVFLTQEEQKIINDREIDIIKRDSHCFNEDSFKGIEYHGQKHKRKDTE